MTHATKEKLLAIQLLGMAKQSVPQFGDADDINNIVISVLTLAAEYARTGADYTVLAVLEYPDTTKANP